MIYMFDFSSELFLKRRLRQLQLKKNLIEFYTDP